MNYSAMCLHTTSENRTGKLLKIYEVSSFEIDSRDRRLLAVQKRQREVAELQVEMGVPA